MISNNFYKLLPLSLPLLALLASEAFAATPPRSRTEWAAQLYGRSSDDSFSSSRVIGAALFLQWQRRFTENLELRFIGVAALETGSSSALFTNEFEPKSRLLLQEASILWRPSFLGLMAGALDQQDKTSPLLIAGGTFPAARAWLEARSRQWWVIRGEAQAAIPTARTLSTRATGKENTPLLFTQTVSGGWESQSNPSRAVIRATAFQFQNLTRGVAQDSRFYGNEVTGIGAASTFVYRYQGFELGPDFVVSFNRRTQLGFGMSFLRNNHGPRATSDGAYGYMDLTYKSSFYKVRPRIEWYRNEADSSPGFYNSAEFGHNNRLGHGASIRVELPEVGVNIELKGRRSEWIVPRTFQKNRFDFLGLTLEIPYAGF